VEPGARPAKRWPAMSDAAADFPLAMLADDVTGGCDAGVQFSLRGATTRVYLELPEQPAALAGVSVIVNHSRGEGPEEASCKVEQACDWIAASGAKLCFKKIDSTLKGNVGAELEAIRNKFPDRLILVSPSFPSMERILLDGWLRVRSSEGIEPVDVLSLLRGQGVRRLMHISQPAGAGASGGLVERIQHAEGAGARIIIIDAVSESHLRAIAEAAVQMVPQPLLVGSAGLAAAWSELLLKAGNSGESGIGESASLVRPVSAESAAVSTGPVVLCIGSTNPVTCQQLQRLADTHAVRRFDWQQDVPDRALAALAEGCHLIVPIQPDSVQLENLRCLFSAIVETPQVRGLLCSGGDTARLVCACLGVQAIQLGGEVVRGLPWGALLGGAADGLPICTKAGGFGNVDALCEAVRFLAAQPRSGENRQEKYGDV
jgi:D-threonate/D-erythronate kinase